MNTEKIYQQSGVRIVPATKKHLREAAKLMRSEDREEIKASGGFTPLRALRASANASKETWAALAANGDLLVVFGVASYPSGWSAPWALSTVNVAKHPLAYWRASKAVLADIQPRYPRMVQMIHARYSAALSWAERLGFKLDTPVPFGVAQNLFVRISMVSPKLEVAGV